MKMRLICPNCGAQYEVSEDVIPEAGRDVQCSNCGHTWFQAKNDPKPETTDLDAAFDEVKPVEPEVWDTPDTSVPEDSLEIPDPTGDSWLDDDDNEQSEDASAFDGGFETPDAPALADVQPDIAHADGPSVPPHRDIDPEVASILREEADRETRARAADASGLETQGDLGLVEADPAVTKREAEIRERMADIQGLPNADPDGPRRELLPDIEEINSSLSARAPENTKSELTDFEYEVQNRKGFRYGFFLVASLVVFTILLYAYGPQVVETIPQAQGIMTDFTAYVDKSRIWLDEAVQRFIAKASAI